MKKLVSVLSAGLLLGMVTGCSESKGRYLNLSTGKTIEVEKDVKTGYMVDKDSREPLYIYVDTKKDDTIYARTGEVINGHVYLDDNNKYVFDGDEKLKLDDGVTYKDGDYKVKIEKEGDMKVKNGDRKVKTDEDGERKVKND